MPLTKNGNSVIVSSIAPRFDNLSNKANEVNNCLVATCGDRDIPFLSHNESINSSKHVIESKLHLNFSSIKVFGEYFSVFLKKFN